MEKQIEDLISRLEMEKNESYNLIEKLAAKDDKSLEAIYSGKIFAFDYRIDELQRIIRYECTSQSK